MSLTTSYNYRVTIAHGKDQKSVKVIAETWQDAIGKARAVTSEVNFNLAFNGEATVWIGRSLVGTG